MQSKKKLLDEEKLLSNSPRFNYEEELKKQVAQEMEEARKIRGNRENKEHFLIETDISKLSNEEKFDKSSIYKIFNRIQKTESFVNGEQAKTLIKYTDRYVVMFDHRRLEA